MRAIILAAGQGIRLGYNIPKCMVEIEGIPLIIRQIEILKDLGIEKIITVIGSGGVWTSENINTVKNTVKKHEVDIIVNEDSLNTHSTCSLRLALEKSEDNCIVLDGDLIFGRNIIEALVKSTEKSTILIAENKEKKGSKVIYDNLPRKGYILRSIGETLESDYVYAGIMKIQKDNLNMFRENLKSQRYDKGILAVFLSDICKSTDIYCLKFSSKKSDINFIELAEMAGGSFSKTSRIVREDENDILVRKESISEGEEKLKDEINWIINLDEISKKHFPKIVRHNINVQRTFYEMAYYDIPSLRTLILNGKLSVDDTAGWLKKILDFYFNNICTCEISDVGDNYIKNTHLKKCFQRLIEASKKVFEFKQVIEYDYIWVNGKKLLNILPIVNTIFNSIEMQQILLPKHLCRTHGDLHFDNILIDLQEENFIMVDPRGTTNYDVYYDIGKIYHSCHSYYDLIHTGNFEIEFSGNSANYQMNAEKEKIYVEIYETLRGLLTDYKSIKDEVNWEIKARFAEAAHMSSVIPFQLKMDGKEDIALMCYARGVELLNDVFNSLKEKLIEVGVSTGDIININTESDYNNAKRIFKK